MKFYGKAFPEGIADEKGMYKYEFRLPKEWANHHIELVFEASMTDTQVMINKRKAGIYWDYVFEMDPLKVIEVRNQYRLDERLIRLLVINYDRPEGVPTVAGATLAD